MGYFDETARLYASAFDTRTTGGHALRARRQCVLDLLENSRGRLLDVGCGPGALARSCLERGFEVWGVDPSLNMITLCRESVPQEERSHFLVGDANALAFKSELFDVVTCTGVFDRFRGHNAAFGEIVRVAKLGGTIVVSFPNLLSPYAVWKLLCFYPTVALLRPFYYRLRGRPQPPTQYTRRLPPLVSFCRGLETPRSIGSQLSDLGVTVTESLYYDFNVFLSPLDELIPDLALGVCERLEYLRAGRLKWLGSGFVVKAIKHREWGGPVRC